jgi:hypothetical protein
VTNRQNKKGRSKNPEGQYAGLPYAMLRSPAWRSLGGSALKVLLELHTRFHGANNGDLSLGLDEAAKTLSIGKATAKAAFDELVEKGFLLLIKKGTFARRHASTYALTFKPIATNPRTDNWRVWIGPEKKPKTRKAWGSKKRSLPPPPENIVRFPDGTYLAKERFSGGT